MALGVWQNTIRDTIGRPIATAQVTVLDAVTNAPRDLFTDRAGAIPLDNPFQADDFGLARFYSAVGRVNIQIVASNRTEQLENVVLIDDFPG